jgi:hypothetical protein
MLQGDRLPHAGNRLTLIQMPLSFNVRHTGYGREAVRQVECDWRSLAFLVEHVWYSAQLFQNRPEWIRSRYRLQGDPSVYRRPSRSAEATYDNIQLPSKGIVHGVNFSPSHGDWFRSHRDLDQFLSLQMSLDVLDASN